MAAIPIIRTVAPWKDPTAVVSGVKKIRREEGTKSTFLTPTQCFVSRAVTLEFVERFYDQTGSQRAAVLLLPGDQATITYCERLIGFPTQEHSVVDASSLALDGVVVENNTESLVNHFFLCIGEASPPLPCSQQ